MRAARSSFTIFCEKRQFDCLFSLFVHRLVQRKRARTSRAENREEGEF